MSSISSIICREHRCVTYTDSSSQLQRKLRGGIDFVPIYY